MKSIKTKTKAKKPNGKIGKVKVCNKEDTPVAPDLFELNQPMDTSVSSLHHVTKLLENSTEQVKTILIHECELVFECRVCRSLFRSLANLIFHKRLFCKKKYDITFAKNYSNDYNMISTEQNLNKALDVIRGNNRILRSQVYKEEEKEDLTPVFNSLKKKQIEHLHTIADQIHLQPIQSSPYAVYQTAINSTENFTDGIRTEVAELENMKEKTAVLDLNGQIVPPSQEQNDKTETENSNDERTDAICGNKLVCSKCFAVFSTKKTLAVHKKTLHTRHRKCYPCLCCSSTFASPWSAYRHLCKVHRQSNYRGYKLRKQISERAFIKENSAAEDSQKEDINKSLPSTLRVSQVEKWISVELQKCGVCGKKYERKAALLAHSQHCRRRTTNENITKSKKTNKNSSLNCSSNESIVIGDSKIQKNDVNVPESSANLTILSKESGDTLSAKESTLQSGLSKNITTVCRKGAQQNTKKNSRLSSANETSASIKIVCNSIDKNKNNVGSKKRKNKNTVQKYTSDTANREENILVEENRAWDIPVENNRTKNVPVEDNCAKNIPIEENCAKNISVKENCAKNVPVKENCAKNIPVVENCAKSILVEDNRVKNIPVAESIECDKDTYVILIKRKIASITNFQKLECLLCNRKFNSLNVLKRHAAIHIGWNRYRCKLCDFKSFAKDDCVTHCNKMHSAQNNRDVIDEMIIRISSEQSAIELKLTETLNTRNPEEKTEEELDAPEVIEVRLSECMESEVEIEEQNVIEKKVEVADTNPVTNCQESIQVNEKSEETENALSNSINGQNIAGLYPAVEKMVMEVIFGSSEDNSTEEAKKAVSSEKCKPNLQNGEDIEARSKDSDSKKSDAVSVQKNSKSQRSRPIRNKIKPLNKDFIYDLEVPVRKDLLVTKLNKQVTKKSAVEEDYSERDIEQPSKRFKSAQKITF